MGMLWLRRSARWLLPLTLGMSSQALAQKSKPHAAKTSRATRKARAAHGTFTDARAQAGRLIRGVDLTGMQRQQVDAIRKRYEVKYRDLEKQQDQVDKTHGSAAPVLTRLSSARAAERAEIAALLTPSQRAAFDRNGRALRQ
jgi:Spy/CpxP family protein refolding chaperone